MGRRTPTGETGSENLDSPFPEFDPRLPTTPFTSSPGRSARAQALPKERQRHGNGNVEPPSACPSACLPASSGLGRCRVQRTRPATTSPCSFHSLTAEDDGECMRFKGAPVNGQALVGWHHSKHAQQQLHHFKHAQSSQHQHASRDVLFSWRPVQIAASRAARPAAHNGFIKTPLWRCSAHT